MKCVLFLLLTIYVFGVFCGVPGGWSQADVNSQGVQNGAKFAVQTRFPELGTDPKFAVREAFQQVLIFFFFEYATL